MKYNYQHTLKTLLLLLASNLLLLTANAQFVKNDWGAYIAGTAAQVNINDIQSDASGNIFICGEFLDTVDFDPGPGVVELISYNQGYNAFFAKYNASGSLVWVKVLANLSSPVTFAYNLTVDASGDVYVSGRSGGALDLDPGVGTSYTPANSNWFLAKYDGNGNFIWGQGSYSTFQFVINDLFINASNELVLLGSSWNSTVPFSIQTLNKTTGVSISSSSFTNSNCASDAYSIGEHFYGKQDNSGNYVVLGSFFGGTLDVDPSGGATILTSVGGSNATPDIFVAKYNSSMALQWAFSLGGENPETSGGLVPSNICTDASGNVYIAGTLADTIDFDPGSGTTLLYPSSSSGAYAERGFIAKYSPSGALVWARTIDENNPDNGGAAWSRLYDLVINSAGDRLYYTADVIQHPKDVDITSGKLIIPYTSACQSICNFYSYYANMDLNGVLQNVNTTHGNASVGIRIKLWTGSGNTIYLSHENIQQVDNYTQNPLTFGACGNSPYPVPNGIYSKVGGAISKYSACNNPPVITSQPIDTVGCLGMELTVGVSVSGATCTKYHWFKKGVVAPDVWAVVSDSSILYFSSFGANDVGDYICTVEGECGSISTNEFTIGSRVPVDMGVLNTPYEASVCAGIDHTFDFATYTSSVLGDAPTYEWKKGNTVLSTTTTATLSNVTTANSGMYWGIATNLCNSDTIYVDLTVNPLPTVVASPTSAAFCAGGSAEINDNAHPNTYYAWLDENYNYYSGSSPLTATVAGTYYLVGYDNTTNCSDTSAAVVVTENSIPAEPTISLNGADLVSNYATGNQWYLDGNIINGATGQSYTPLVNGNYTVEHTDANGCTSLQSTPYNVNSVGIENTVDAGVSITPNPSSGVFIVSVNNQSAYQIEVHNSLGQLVYTAGTHGSTTTIDLQNHAAGVYTITITDGEQVMHSKVIKN